MTPDILAKLKASKRMLVTGQLGSTYLVLFRIRNSWVLGSGADVADMFMEIVQPIWNDSSFRMNKCFGYSIGSVIGPSNAGLRIKQYCLSCTTFWLVGITGIFLATLFAAEEL